MFTFLMEQLETLVPAACREGAQRYTAGSLLVCGIAGILFSAKESTEVIGITHGGAFASAESSPS